MLPIKQSTLRWYEQWPYNFRCEDASPLCNASPALALACVGVLLLPTDAVALGNVLRCTNSVPHITANVLHKKETDTLIVLLVLLIVFIINF